MASSVEPFRPYLAVHQDPSGTGDARPTAQQIIADYNAQGALVGKSIVITGASGGIGLATAEALYASGAQLLLTARDMPKMKKGINGIVAEYETESAFPDPIVVEMHLDDLQSVRRGAEFIRSKVESVDILIMNAGIGGVPLQRTKDGFEMQMGVNYFSHFLLFHLLRPLLAPASRIITLASAAHLVSGINFSDINYTTDPSSYDKITSYAQSKTADIYLATSIHRHYRHLLSVSVHPGGILQGSELSRYMDAAEYRALAESVTDRSAFKSVEQGAATTVWAAVAAEVRGGKYLADCGEGVEVPEELVGQLKEGPWFARHAFDGEAEERLWKVSFGAVGLEEDGA